MKQILIGREYEFELLAQVMLRDRRDRVINVCEMKFSINEFAIDKDYDNLIRDKMETF